MFEGVSVVMLEKRLGAEIQEVTREIRPVCDRKQENNITFKFNGYRLSSLNGFIQSIKIDVVRVPIVHDLPPSNFLYPYI